MYKRFYGLGKNPFELSPDAGTLFLSETHKEGLATLKYGVLSKKLFVILTGGVGTGKTTLINVFVKSLRPTVKVCILVNPLLTAAEFFSFIAAKLGLPYSNKAHFLSDFSSFLKKCMEAQQRVVLIIDEAQVLPIELLEEIRLLSNQAGEGSDVLSIFLVGQPELLERLADERLLPLRQRIGIRFHLETFSLEDTIHYVFFRLNRAGAMNTALFSEAALHTIHRATRGNPRLINILCDHALLSGFSHEQAVIDDTIILECVRELQLPGDTKMYDLSFLPSGKRKKRTLLLLSSLALLLVSLAVFLFSDWRSGIPAGIKKYLGTL